MKPEIKEPELAEAIASHARSVLSGNIEAAEASVAHPALEPYRVAMAEALRLWPFNRFETPGFARIGTHYISKVRFLGERGSALMQIRWKREPGGDWIIAEAEYFPAGRNPWTGVKPPRPAANRAAADAPDRASK
jgi:hypothetical protein